MSVSAVGLPEASLSDQINAAILAARGGTLFVDEISELPLTLQARLLRLLEGGLSAPDGLPYDQRVIASTTRTWASWWRTASSAKT